MNRLDVAMRRIGFGLCLGLLFAASAEAKTFWVDDHFEPVAQDKAIYKAEVADEEQAGGWELVIKRIEDGSRRFHSQVDQPDLTADDLAYVGDYELYREDGDHSLLEAGHRDAEGEYHGLITIYNEDGSRDETAEYVHGQRDGIRREYTDGQVRVYREYKNGKLNGVLETYITGDVHALRSRTDYVDGRINGWDRVWWGNGDRMEREVHFVDDEKNGIARYFSREPDAHLVKREGHYTHGERTGPWREFNSQGEIIGERVYADDGSERVISETEYNAYSDELERKTQHLGQGDDKRRVVEQFNDGYVWQRRINYTNISRTIVTRFTDDGQVYDRHERRHGKPYGLYIEDRNGYIAYGHFDDNGRQNGVERHYRDGARVAVAHYKNGRPDGEYRGYDSDKVITRGQYDNGQRIGDWTITKHGLVEQGRYEKGQRVGHWTETNRSKGWQAEGDYENGREQGVWLIRDEDGQILDCPRYDKGRRGDTPDFDAPGTPSAETFCKERMADTAAKDHTADDS